MVNIIVQLSKYLMILMITVYTYLCFSIFGYYDPDKKKRCLRKQNVLMFLLHMIAFLVMYLQTNETKMIGFYGMQVVLFLAVILLYTKIYPRVSRLVVNNMCMLMAVGFVMIARLSYTKCVKQFAIAVAGTLLTLAIPWLLKTVKSFRKMGKKPPVYNENRISKLWLKKNKLFIGYNCRITAYDLMKDYIKVGNTGKANPSQLFMDQDALKNAPTKKFSGKQRKAFESVFSTVQTQYTKNVATHAAIWAKDWKNKKISVSGKTKATLISVVLHSSFSKTENELFVGHTGVLVPTKNHKYLFIEKLSFQLPYQVTRFESKEQLNDYLMGMYDTEWGQDTAKPFIMENTKLMKEYHAVSDR